jgi:hypothetical protein
MVMGWMVTSTSTLHREHAQRATAGGEEDKKKDDLLT